jgi:hypothetical protein
MPAMARVLLVVAGKAEAVVWSCEDGEGRRRGSRRRRGVGGLGVEVGRRPTWRRGDDGGYVWAREGWDDIRTSIGSISGKVRHKMS